MTVIVHRYAKEKILSTKNQYYYKGDIMATRKKTESSKSLKEPKTTNKVTQTETIRNPDGTIEGEYSKSVYVNNELVSFDIDWDKLKEHMKKI